MIKRLKTSILGDVTMVMFRDFAKRKADSLNLVGYVKNTDKGGVEVVSEGEEVDLVKFLSLLHKGPALARVDDVISEWSEPMGEFKDFSIRYRNFLDRL